MKRLMTAILGVSALVMLSSAAQAQNHTHTLELNKDGSLNVVILNKSGAEITARSTVIGIGGPIKIQPNQQIPYVLKIGSTGGQINMYNGGDSCFYSFIPPAGSGTSVVVESQSYYPDSDCDIYNNGIMTIALNHTTK